MDIAIFLSMYYASLVPANFDETPRNRGSISARYSVDVEDFELVPELLTHFCEFTHSMSEFGLVCMDT